MNDGKGFAIRCPHCGNWDEYPDTHPSQVSVTHKEIKSILQKFDEAVRNKRVRDFAYEEKKMFRCKSPRWICPASYELFILNHNNFEEFKGNNNKWIVNREFKLFKMNKKDRWDDADAETTYSCVMFVREPVPRQPHIELEHLIDPVLASEVIRGLRHELHTPLTIYSANIIKGQKETLYWMPIEAYSTEIPCIPTGYNVFCRTCRQIITKYIENKVIEKFNGRNIEPQNCPFGYYDQNSHECAGRKAACEYRQENQIDWNHCPGFIDERVNTCFCYISDKELIEKVKEEWLKNGVSRVRATHKCPAGFIEEALPIIVHEHLVGVAMSGQMYYHWRDIREINEFMVNIEEKITVENPLLEYKDELIQVRFDLFSEEKKKREGRTDLTTHRQIPGSLILKEEELEARLDLLDKNVERIEKVAEIRYRDARCRSENAFRDELMNFTKHTLIDPIKLQQFFKGQTAETPIIHILKRMRTFWAFEASAFLFLSKNDNLVKLISYSISQNLLIHSGMTSKEEAFSFEGTKIEELNYVEQDISDHPVSWLKDYEHRPDREYPKENLLREICHLLERSDHVQKLQLDKNDCYFIILVPFENNIYSFVFFKRDKEELSGTTAKKSTAVSELCQEFILRTCTEMTYELCNVRYRQEHKLKEPKTGRIIATKSDSVQSSDDQIDLTRT